MIDSILLGVISVLLLWILVSIKKSKSAVPQIQFNETLITAFENWLNKSISMYMIRYITEKKGKEMLKDEEIPINSEFALTGIDYVCTNIFKAMPNLYQKYMMELYGQEKLIASIHDKVLHIFTEYVNNERKKRLYSKKPES